MRQLKTIVPLGSNNQDKKKCVICGRTPTQIVSFDVDGTTRRERYCDNCIKSVSQWYHGFAGYISNVLQNMLMENISTGRKATSLRFIASFMSSLLFI